jgi:hypothetical protein
VHRPEASSIRRQAVSSSCQPEGSWLLQPAVQSAWCARAVCCSQEAVVAGSDGWVARLPEEPGASAQPPVAAQQEVSAAAAGLQRAAA